MLHNFALFSSERIRTIGHSFTRSHPKGRRGLWLEGTIASLGYNDSLKNVIMPIVKAVGKGIIPLFDTGKK
jgi:hypothetical protein